jgi:tRNA dimethylallyltransferase
MNLLTVLGPTATGKTHLSALLAFKYNGEIISADSRQVYKGMDLGTGKDYSDYLINSIPIKYHLLDILEPSDEYDAFTFKQDFVKVFNDITKRNKLPILTGGTGLYLSTVLQNYELRKADLNSLLRMELDNLTDEKLRERLWGHQVPLHNTTDLLSRERIINAILVIESAQKDFADTSFVDSVIIGLNPGREIVKQRITSRLEIRLKNGMIDEVDALLKKGISRERLLLFGLEYKFITLYLTGDINYNDMVQKLRAAIHDFAKRQMTWYRKMEREGVDINWIDSPDLEKASQIIDKFIS